MKVWIDQDLCTGDGLCEEIAPDVFFGKDDGLYYVKETASNFGTEKLFDGETNPAGAEGMARVHANFNATNEIDLLLKLLRDA